MTAAESSVTSPPARTDTAPVSAVYTEGMLAGLIGAATIAVWFLILDTLNGRPFYTPTVLGTALFRGGAGLEEPETLAVSFEMVLTFTWVHVLAFVVIGGAASHLIAAAERNANLGFGVLLLFVVFECGFFAACVLFAQPVLRALAWPEVLVGNLLAAGAMAVTFWRRHPRLTILP
jgi:hypothetical protein